MKYMKPFSCYSLLLATICLSRSLHADVVALNTQERTLYDRITQLYNNRQLNSLNLSFLGVSYDEIRTILEKQKKIIQSTPQTTLSWQTLKELAAGTIITGLGYLFNTLPQPPQLDDAWLNTNKKLLPMWPKDSHQYKNLTKTIYDLEHPTTPITEYVRPLAPIIIPIGASLSLYGLYTLYKHYAFTWNTMSEQKIIDDIIKCIQKLQYNASAMISNH